LHQGKGYFILLYPSRREMGKTSGIAKIVDMLQKVNKQITNITFDDFLHMLNNITHESKKNAIAYNTL
jgi:hypothetical protein